MLPKFRAKIVKGQPVIAVQQFCQYEAYLAGLEGKDVEIIVQRPQHSKSTNQLAYLHGVVFRLASEESGYTPNEVKGLLKGEFLTEYVVSKTTGKEIPIVKSLADLSVGQMAEFIDSCIILVAKNWHVVVPSPDTVVIK